MQQSSQRPTSEKLTKVSLTNGKDEMNLAEFPLVKLGKRDKRKFITYERMVRPKHGEQYVQKWEVQGGSIDGLPDETGDRVIIALMKLTAEQGFTSKKVTFSPYKVLKLMRLVDSTGNYQALKRVLKQLAAITVFSERAFYDKKTKKRVTYNDAFHVIDKVRWIRKKTDKDIDVEDEETSKAYVIWSDTIWKSLESGYIKNLDLEYYYSLENAIARRLYRFLDKWLYKKNEWEFDVFDVTDRLGMVRYRYPSEAKKALIPACEELKNRGFLADYEFHKKGKYTRIHFMKVARPTLWDTLAEDDAVDEDDKETTPPTEASEDSQAAPAIDEWEAIYERYETSEELKNAWGDVLKELEISASQTVYKMHLVNTALLQTQDGVATLGTTNNFAADWLQNRMQKKISQALNRHLDTTITKVEFISIRDQAGAEFDS